MSNFQFGAATLAAVCDSFRVLGIRAGITDLGRTVKSIALAAGFVATVLAGEAVAQDSASVVVETDRVEIRMGRPLLRVRVPKSEEAGFYSWRFDVLADSTARVALASIVLAADTAMRTANARDVVRSSTLRRCAEPRDFSSRRCTMVLNDSARVDGESLRIVIRDSTIVALMWLTRPRTVTSSVFQPGGRFRVDQMGVRFVEPDTGSR